jgi:hypothetical protein
MFCIEVDETAPDARTFHPASKKMTGRLKQPIWIVPLAIAGLVAVFGWWGNARLRQTIEDQLKAKLTSTLNANVTALAIWATNQTRLAMVLAEDPEVRTVAVRLLERSPQPGPEFRRPGTVPELEEFGTYLRARLKTLGYEQALLVNTNLLIVAGAGRGRAGLMPVPEAQTNKFSELFAFEQPILITPYKPPELRAGPRFPAREGGTNEFRRGRPGRRGAFGPRGPNEFQQRRGDATLMQVAAPVRDTNNIVRGALALIINPTNEFTRTLSVARMGDTGETYAFDQTGLLISRFFTDHSG